MLCQFIRFFSWNICKCLCVRSWICCLIKWWLWASNRLTRCCCWSCLCLMGNWKEIKPERKQTRTNRRVAAISHPLFSAAICWTVSALHARTHTHGQAALKARVNIFYSKCLSPAYLRWGDVTESKILTTDAHSSRFARLKGAKVRGGSASVRLREPDLRSKHGSSFLAPVFVPAALCGLCLHLPAAVSSIWWCSSAHIAEVWSQVGIELPEKADVHTRSVSAPDLYLAFLQLWLKVSAPCHTCE